MVSLAAKLSHENPQHLRSLAPCVHPHSVHFSSVSRMYAERVLSSSVPAASRASSHHPHLPRTWREPATWFPRVSLHSPPAPQSRPHPPPSKRLQRPKATFQLLLVQIPVAPSLCPQGGTFPSHTSCLSFPGFAGPFSVLGLFTCSFLFRIVPYSVFPTLVTSLQRFVP